MKKGILLINLGTPNSPKISDVRKYLRQFLSDPRVITLPAIVRNMLLYFFILPFRPRNSAKAYKKIWTTDGSPLLLNSISLVEKLQAKYTDNTIVKLAMRYGKPSIEQAIKKLYAENITNLTIVPLFPQYSSAATGSAIEKTLTTLQHKNTFPYIKIINQFYQRPEFINASSVLIKQHLNNNSWEHILFSYHGLPENHLNAVEEKNICDRKKPCPNITKNNFNCYRAQCYATTRLLVNALELNSEQYSTSFQSRLGRTPWIKPYTDEILHDLRNKGIKNLAVVCPSFVADCLETLEEIQIALQDTWLKLGGEKFVTIPCLNDATIWVDALYKIVKS